MSYGANRLAIRKNLGREDTLSIDQQLKKIEDDIRKLKIDFGIYFVGGLKRPPHEARGRVEAQLKRLADINSMELSRNSHLTANFGDECLSNAAKNLCNLTFVYLQDSQ
jgi:hypothetical protein